MVKDNKITGIIDMEEQSDEFNMRFVLVLKPGTDPNYVRNELYKNTALMQTLRVNLKVLDINDKQHPAKRLSYKGYLQAWIDFRKITKLRLFENMLQKKMTILHMYDLYIWAIESGKSEDIIKIIKSNKGIDDNVLIEALIKKCKITDIQAKYFINCEIKKLSKGYLNSYKEKAAKLKEETDFYRNAILTDGVIEQIIIQELLDIKMKYGEPRKCKLISESEANGITAGTFKIVITEGNFIKKVGEMEALTKPKNDNIKFVLTGDNSKSILLFDAFGKVYNIPISKIPFADKGSNGVDIRLINKYINSQITAVIYEPVLEKFNKGFIVTLTQQGFIKRMTTTDFLAVPTSGLVYCKLDDNDKIIDLLLFGNHAEIVVYGAKKALRIDINDIPILKRNARGCVSMSSKTTKVEGMSAMNKQFSDIVIVTKNGYINRIIPDSVIKGRSKAGSNVIKLGKTDNIVSIYGVNNNDTLVVLTAPTGEAVEIPIATIANGTSIGTGNKMIKGEVVKVYKK
jgi:DNA gyrase subunit A